MSDTHVTNLKVVPEINHFKEDFEELQVLLGMVSEKIDQILNRDYRLEFKVIELEQPHDSN